MNKARILIVDDGTAGAGDLGGQLVELGYEPVGHTTRGAEAILLAGQLRPDLVLMDISLAGEMNSLAAAQAIHDQFALPVVFLTRFVAEEVMDHAQLAEPFGYLSKPFDRGKLRMVIEMAIYKQSVERQYQARGEWHRSILQKAMDGFWLTDPQGRLLEVNETYCQMSGYSAPELLAMRISDLEAVETAAVTALRIQKIMAQGADRFESRHRRKDGSLFEVEVSVQYQPANGRRLVVFLRDITARKQAEESLRLDNQIMAHMADGVYLIRERDGVIVYTNDRFEKMFGYAPGELLGQPGAVVNAPTPQPPEVTAQAIIAELGRTGVWEGEIQNRKKDGSTFWCQARVSTFVHGSYGPVWVALHQDITSRKLAEEELRVHQMEVLTQNEELRRSQMELDASRARYFDLFDLAPVGYVTIGKRGLILENNLTAARLLGVARGALIRKPFSRFIFKEDSDSYLQLRKQLFDTSAPQTCDLRMVRSDGPPFWVHLAATAAQDAAGAPVCRVTLSDITARKQAEAALRLSDEALRRILSATRDGYWCVSARGDLLEVNPRYVQQSGYSREELLGMNITDLDPQVSAAFIEANSRRTAEQGSDQFETIHRRKDGTTWHVEASITCSGVVGEKFFVFLRDITERKQAEAALAQSAERHAAILHTAMDGFWLADPQGHLLEVNETYCQMSGYSAPELLTMRIPDLEASETSEATAAHLQIVMAQGADRFESRHHRKDGSLFEVEVSVQYQPGDGGRLVTFLRDITQRKQAEVERRESETKFRLLTENIQDVFWLTTPAGDRMLYVSPAFENIWGRTCASLYQQPRSFAEAIHSEDRERLFAAMQEHAQDNWEVEYRILRPDGTLRWILDRAFPIRDERGAVTLICGVAKDITERKQAEAALHDANWRMASIIEGTHVGTWEWNIQTGEAVFNEVWAEMIGYTLEELAPISIKTWQMYVHPEDGAQSAQLLERHFAGERPYYDCECRMKHKAGHWVWVRDRGRVITRNSAGQPLMMFGTHADITTRKQAEVALREREATFRALADTLPLAIYLSAGVEQVSEYVSPTMVKMFGYTQADIPSVAQWWPLAYPDETYRRQIAAEWTRRVEHSLATQSPIAPMETVVTCKDGSQRYVSWGYITLGEKNYAFGLDLTERNRAEQAVNREQALSKAIIDSIPGAFYVLDESGRYVRWNAYQRDEIVGQPEARVAGMDAAATVHPDDRALVQSKIANVLGHGLDETVEGRVLLRGGPASRWLLLTGRRLMIEGRPFLVGIGIDLTTRKQAEEKLRELSIAVEQSPASIVITDPAGNIEYVNPKFNAVTGYSTAEVLGKNPRLLKSGATSPEAYRNLWQTITAGQEWRGEFHNQKKNGELFWESVTISPIRDSAGRITHYVAVKEDISARKQAEAERSLMELQLRQAQKLESIGQLAAGIAHEINTPTQYIGDNTRFLQDAFKDITQVLDHYARLLQAARQQQVTPELIAATTAAAAAADITYLAQEVPKSIEQTLQGVAHVAKIVRAMKDFSHPGSEAKVPTDLNHAIESTVTVAHNEWKYVADLDLVLDPQLPRVSCLPGELNQVILNLVINAAHAIGDVVGDGAGGKGRIRVSTSRQGDWAEIRVQDSGTGIPEAVRGRIFDPFFTTKAVGKGTGQGLTIAHLVVVKQHGGTIEFETALGKGTTFIVRLPFQPSPALERKV